MDIWRWVWGRDEALREEGHNELADYIYSISNHTVNDRFDLVDQVYHAAIPLCRALDDKWLEVYFRHWRLQAHVLKNYDAKGNLHEAISLLDFAHQDDTKECPQRICVVQDLASCYGIKDGPGFAEERISVCKETLAQIDGSWPCYECVSSELLDALIDAKKYEQASEEIKAVDAEVSKFQKRADDELILTKTRLLLATAKYEAAWGQIKDAKNPEGGEGFVRHVALLKTLTLCHLGRWDEAQETVPRFDEIVLAGTYYSDWTEIQILLEGQGLIENTADLRYKFHSLADKLIIKDAMRVAFDVCRRLVALCIDANETLRAEFVVKTMRSIVGELNRDLGASENLKEVERLVADMAAPGIFELPDTVDALLDHKFETQTQAFAAFAKALQKWPDEGRLYARKSDLFQSHFQIDAAYDFLKEAYKMHRGSGALESRYGSAFLAKHGFEAYEDEFPMDQLEGLSKEAIWNRGFKYVTQYKTSEPIKTLEYLRVVERYWPEDVWLLGQIARQNIVIKDYDAAIEYRRKQIAVEPDNNNRKWDLLIAGTLAENSSLIIEMGKSLGMELDENGHYPDGHRDHMRIQWEMRDGGLEIYHARRIGPALARISSICRINDAHQLYGREVVFDPAPLNKLDQKDDEGYNCDIEGNYSLLYPPPLLTLKDPSYHTYTADGLHPGEAALKLLSEQMNAAGFIYREWSTDAYTLTWTDGDTQRTDPAIYVYILIQDGEEERLHQILSDFSAGLEHPLIWPELAKALKDEALRLEQGAISEKYGIED